MQVGIQTFMGVLKGRINAGDQRGLEKMIGRHLSPQFIVAEGQTCKEMNQGTITYTKAP